MKRGHVADVEKAVKAYFKSEPRVLVEATAGEDPDRTLQTLVEGELSRSGKLTVVASAADRKRLRRLRKATHGVARRDDQKCELGQEISPSSVLVARRYKAGKAGERLSLSLQSLETGCMTQSATVKWMERDPAGSVSEGVSALLDTLRRPTQMPMGARPTPMPTGARPTPMPTGARVVRTKRKGTPSTLVPTGACAVGKSKNPDTQGHCCWPGQIWGENRCFGTPTSCPAGTAVEGEMCAFRACPAGKTRMPNGVTCCWPGQLWAASQSRCVGTPKCGEGLMVADGACVPATPKGWVKISAGSFTMGSRAGESDEKPTRTVRITRAFFLQTTEVTQGQWKALMGTSPSSFSSCGSNCPVEQVSWFDAAAYCNALSKRERLPGCYTLSGCRGEPGDGSYTCSSATSVGPSCRGYRLPTEAEWEYAARAGTTGPRYGAVTEVAWFKGNSGGKTHQVGTKRANRWGLHDTLGNVWEWTGDWKADYSSGTATDPTGPESAGNRVGRGGSWIDRAGVTRAADRLWYPPAWRCDYLGFRPARFAAP